MTRSIPIELRDGTVIIRTKRCVIVVHAGEREWLRIEVQKQAAKVNQ